MKNLALVVFLFACQVSAQQSPSKPDAQKQKVSRILQKAHTLGVFCGEDVEMQTCKFFANAIRVHLAKIHVGVLLDYEPDRQLFGVQSFFVMPRGIPIPEVTVRLIEDVDSSGVTRVYLGGFCFDFDSGNWLPGTGLPRWSEVESARNIGPLELDRANAASRLAREFSTYWLKITGAR